MSDDSPLTLPEDFSGQVCLFPLSNNVTFPSSVQALHIFEGRYREMFEDAIKSDRLMAMATLLPGHEIDYYSRPPVAPVICVGRITRYHRNDNGTYDFLLLGLQRARIDHEITPVRSYRRAAVQLLDEPSLADCDEVRELRRQLTARLANHAPKLRKLLELLAKDSISLGVLTDLVAQNLTADVAFKLELLGEIDPLVRARVLLDHFSGAPQFSSN